MTAPEPPRVPVDWAPSASAWCRRCEIHWATHAQPLCPSCLDDAVQEAKG